MTGEPQWSKGGERDAGLGHSGHTGSLCLADQAKRGRLTPDRTGPAVRLRVFLAAMLATVLAAPAAGQVTVQGDARAWQDVTAAYDRLAALRTYRMKITGAGVPTGGIRIEIVNPDRRRTVVPMGQGGFETIIVGKEGRTRTGNGPWQCQVAPGSLIGGPGGWPPDPRTAKGEVAVTRLGFATLEGARTQSYEVVYTPSANAKPVTIRVFVLQNSGVLRRIGVLDKEEKVTVTIDYYDFNASITIELPACK